MKQISLAICTDVFSKIGKAMVWKMYRERVDALENEGCTTSDAQAVADVEFNQQYGMGWER